MLSDRSTSVCGQTRLLRTLSGSLASVVAIAALAVERGVTIRYGTPVDEILVCGGRACGVERHERASGSGRSTARGMARAW